MKLSADTVGILKNFSSISQGIYVPGGSKLRIKDSSNRILAEANVTENFPSFCVADLNKFLGILTVDRDADFDFKGSDIIITMLGGKSRISYRCSPKNLVNTPKDTELSIEEPFCSLVLTNETLLYVEKIRGLLSLPKIAIENDGSKYFIRIFDPSNDGENQQTMDIEATGDAANFQIIFDAEVLRFVPGDYTVSLGKGLSEFKHKTLDLKYWVAPDLGSTYES